VSSTKDNTTWSKFQLPVKYYLVTGVVENFVDKLLISIALCNLLIYIGGSL